MAELIYLEIGGTNFAIHNDISGDLQIPEPAYRSFIIRQGLSTKPVDFSINLRKGRTPETESLKKIFDSDQA